jgi:glycosyltransferase involved in cell wall biosynthesis
MPCFNEAACVEATVREALAVLDRLRAEGGGEGEVVVVDDGSTDATPDILGRVAAEDPRLRVIRHDRNGGIAAFNPRMLAEARGEWVLFTSSDGEFDPAEAIGFLALAEREGADAVLGYRAEKQYTPYRRAVSWSFNALTLASFGARFRDIGSMRMLRRALFQPIRLYSRSAFLNAERLLVGRRNGAVIVEVPIRHRSRLAGVGKGSRPGKVAAAVKDLARTQARWFRFGRFYG